MLTRTDLLAALACLDAAPACPIHGTEARGICSYCLERLTPPRAPQGAQEGADNAMHLEHRARCVEAIGLTAYEARQAALLNHVWGPTGDISRLLGRIDRIIVDLWLLQNC